MTQKQVDDANKSADEKEAETIIEEGLFDDD
jgi:hypothetical protein